MASQPLHIKAGQSGRVVLPKEIRDRMGIREGTEFEVEEREEVILLKPVRKEALIIKKNGWFVVKASGGKKLSEDIVLKTIEKIREDRSKVIIGSFD